MDGGERSDPLGLDGRAHQEAVQEDQCAGLDAEFLAHFAAGGGGGFLAGQQMPADGGVPQAGRDVLGGRAPLQQQAAPGVAHVDARDGVDQFRMAVALAARRPADHAVLLRIVQFEDFAGIAHGVPF